MLVRRAVLLAWFVVESGGFVEGLVDNIFSGRGSFGHVIFIQSEKFDGTNLIRAVS